MSDNGNLRSMILDAAGERAASPTMEAPSGSSPFFGWLAAEGFATIRLENVIAMQPNPNRRGEFGVILAGGIAMGINELDGKRLMRRLGWTEAKRVAGTTQ